MPDAEGADTEALIATLAEAQRLGFLGARDLRVVVAHAMGYADAIRDVASVSARSAIDGSPHIVDLGSGGGVPGLVIASALPEARLTLVDRRAKRTDFLERAVRRLRWQGRVEVVCDDVEVLIRRQPRSYDAAVARGFGPPADTLDAACRLIAAGGRIVISEPPAGDRWDADDLRRRRLVHRDVDATGGRLAVFQHDPRR